MTEEAKSGSIATRFEYWFAIYAVYLFLAGWTYLDYYFAVFGASAGWLEFGLNDTLARGFTVLFGTGAWMSVVYLIVLLVSLIVEIFLTGSGRLVSTVATLLLVIMFIPTYCIARHAGIRQANIDRGSTTMLPTVTFSDKKCTYRGDLLYAKGGLLYVHNLVNVLDATATDGMNSAATKGTVQAETKPSATSIPKCPIEVGKSSGMIPQLWLVRLEGLEDVRIVHYQKEVRP
jgi:hypothetical protein